MIGPIRRKLVCEQAADSLREYLRLHRQSLFMLPPMIELAKQLGVSPTNARRAIDILREEGVVEVVSGKGVFTRPPIGLSVEWEKGPALGIVCYSERVAMDFLQDSPGFYRTVLQGAMQAAGGCGYRLLLHWIPTDIIRNPGLWQGIEAFTVRNSLDGLLLLCLTDEELVRWILEHAQKPCLLIDHWCKGLEIDTVNPDNRGAAYLATRGLIEAGNRDVACLFHRKPEMNLPRLEGHKDALREAGLPVREELIVPTELNEEGGERAIRLLQEKGVGFSAVVTFEEGQARGAARALRSQGRRMEIVTFGMNGLADEPAIRVIDMQPEAVGKRAVERLVERIRNPFLPAQDLTAPVRVSVVAKGASGGMAVAAATVPGPGQ